MQAAKPQDSRQLLHRATLCSALAAAVAGGLTTVANGATCIPRRNEAMMNLPVMTTLLQQHYYGTNNLSTTTIEQ